MKIFLVVLAASGSLFLLLAPIAKRHYLSNVDVALFVQSIQRRSQLQVIWKGTVGFQREHGRWPTCESEVLAGLPEAERDAAVFEVASEFGPKRYECRFSVLGGDAAAVFVEDPDYDVSTFVRQELDITHFRVSLAANGELVFGSDNQAHFLKPNSTP